MGNIQLSGDQETPPYGYSCLHRFPSTRPLRYSSDATSTFSSFSSRPPYCSSAGDGPILSSPMCCQPPGQQTETFKNRDEALMKARYYRERDFELAIRAYSAALDFAPPVFRRSPPPLADDEQVLYVQLLDPTGYRGNCKDNESLRRLTEESEGTQKILEQCGEAATEEAARRGCWEERARNRDAGTSNSGDGGQEELSGESLEGTSSTAFGGSDGVSRMQSKDFRESPEDDSVEAVRGAAGPCAESWREVYGIPRQQACAKTCSRSSSMPPRAGVQEETKALAAYHALTAEICDEVAQLYLAAGHKEEALRYYDRAVRLAPHAVEFLYRRGVVLQLIGEEDAAIDSFRKALELDPAYKAALFNLGTCLMRSDSGRKEALQLFHKLTELDPTNDQVLSLMAHCYEADGRYEEALSYRQRAVQLDPGDFRANRELNQLEQHLLAIGARRRAAQARPAESELVALSGQRHVLGKVA